MIDARGTEAVVKINSNWAQIQKLRHLKGEVVAIGGIVVVVIVKIAVAVVTVAIVDVVDEAIVVTVVVVAVKEELAASVAVVAEDAVEETTPC